MYPKDANGNLGEESTRKFLGSLYDFVQRKSQKRLFHSVYLLVLLLPLPPPPPFALLSFLLFVSSSLLSSLLPLLPLLPPFLLHLPPFPLLTVPHLSPPSLLIYVLRFIRI